MPTRRRLTLIIVATLLLCGATLVLTRLPCPPRGCTLTAEKRALVLLKNRDTPPRATDFDSRATLDALLAPGEDLSRWSDARAGAIEGYVIDVQTGSIEAANCFSFTRRDVHIHVAPKPDSLVRESVVVEVTPRSAEAARARGEDWSLDALRRALTHRRCRFEGWLMFDREHAAESENTAPGNPVNWRATAWELHPVTRIEVIK